MQHEHIHVTMYMSFNLLAETASCTRRRHSNASANGLHTCTPLGASSITRQFSGATPTAAAAARKISGAGLPCGTSSPQTTLPSSFLSCTKHQTDGERTISIRENGAPRSHQLSCPQPTSHTAKHAQALVLDGCRACCASALAHLRLATHFGVKRRAGRAGCHRERHVCIRQVLEQPHRSRQQRCVLPLNR
eukprot:354470-Chlamydomonas_euryale.AAC.17